MDNRLKHITFTGVDEKTDLNVLQEIQRTYPIAEFGVLVSKNWIERGNRYMDPNTFNKFRGLKLNLSLHVCGRLAHEATLGAWNKVNHTIGGNLNLFHRVQLNVSTRKDNPNRLASCPNRHTEVIVQQRDVNNTPLFDNSYWLEGGVSVLLDASGGRGVDTKIDILPISSKVGYAGGINPENVGNKLEYLLEHHTTGDFWIDMETGVRTDDWFDIDKVYSVLQTCDKIIKISQ